MKIKQTLSSLLMASLFCFTSCSSDDHNKKAEEPAEQAEEVNDEKFEGDQEKDADRLAKAYTGNLYEIRLSEQAALRAQTVDVKKLAGSLVIAHTKMNTDLQTLAGKKNITLPTDISDDQRRDLEDLGEKNGYNYDKEYTQTMKKKHEDAVDLYEKTANRTEDAEIKSWANQNLAEVRSHLEMVEATLEKVKDLKEEDREKKKEKNSWDGKSELHDGREDHHDKPAR